MELLLLSANDVRPEGNRLVDPSPDKISEAIMKLSELSGERRPRALLLHDNGKDFVQFFGRRTAPPRNCHIQYFEFHPGESDPKQYFTEGKNLPQVTALFRRFSKRTENWNGGIYWKPLKPRRFDEIRIAARVVGGLALTIAGLFALGGSVLVGSMLLSGGLWMFWYIPFLLRTAGAIGVPWTAKTSSRGFTFMGLGGGGGCSNGGGCGSGDGGDGGGERVNEWKDRTISQI